MPDREKVIEGLKLCRVGYCDYKCPYVSINVGCKNQLLDDAIALLEEQNTGEDRQHIVRCKDCKYRRNIFPNYCDCIQESVDDNFFCALGKRK